MPRARARWLIVDALASELGIAEGAFDPIEGE
jgi:hypothetical protein